MDMDIATTVSYWSLAAIVALAAFIIILWASDP